MGEDDVHPHRWFRREELSTCPACGEQEALSVPTAGALLCLACGHLSNVGPSEAPQKRDAAGD
jgi:hypothetical protein